MARTNFNNEIWIEIKRLYVYDGQTANAISKMEGMPTAATILKRAKATNNEGLNWDDEKQQFQSERLALLAPGGLAIKIFEKIEKFLTKDITKFSTKDADAIAKLHKSLERVLDKRYHVHMMIEVLTDYMKFLRENYPELVADGKIFNSARNYKNTMLNKLGVNV